MSGHDRAYFQRRAEQEVEAAQRSDKPEAVAIHYQLAERYLDRLGSTAVQEETATEAA